MSQDFFSYTGNPTPAPEAAAGVSLPESPPTILGQLSDADWEKFIGFTARRRYPAGGQIIAAGETERALFFVVSGSVRVESAGGEISSLSGGAVVGVLSFLDRSPSAVRAAADGPAEVLRLNAEALEQLAAWQPRIAMALLLDLGAHVAARLRRFQNAD
jgi:glutaminase